MILDAFSLQGKVAVVSGCDTGLGQGMALGLAEAGCDIVGINIVEPTETLERVTALGRRFLSLTADLRKIDAIPELLDRAVAEFGHIDILVNNAGLIRREDAINFSERDWDDVMDLNIKSVFFMSQAAAKHFIAQGNGGKIVNMRIVNAQQNGRLRFRFVHARQKQRRIAVVLLQRAVAQAHLVWRERFTDALDHTVVKDVGPLVEGALRRKNFPSHGYLSGHQ